MSDIIFPAWDMVFPTYYVVFRNCSAVFAGHLYAAKNGVVIDIYSFYKAIKSKYAILLLILRANRMEYEQDFENREL